VPEAQNRATELNISIENAEFGENVEF